jgi:hypothetical protein
MEYKISETLQKYYDQVFQDGKLVNINVSLWGMSYRLREEDLKIEQKLPDVIQLGKKMLIKPEVYNTFKRLEGKARNYLYANSFSFPLVKQAHFVPRKKYLKVYEDLANFKESFKELKDAFLLNYPEYKKEALEYYSQFKDQINIEDLESHYPSVEAICDKFAFEIMSFEIKLPTEFGDTDIQREVVLEEAGKEAQKNQEKQYQVEYKERLDTHMSKITDFVNDVVGTLRSKVVEHCSVVLRKVNKREVVSDKSISTLLEHIDEFRQMNFIEDKAIESELSKLEGLLTKGSDFTSNIEAVQELRTSLTSIIDEAKGVTDIAAISGQYFRKLSI